MLPSTGDFPFRLNVIIISLMLPSSFINWGWSTANHGPIRKVKGVLGSGSNVNMSLKAKADANHEIEPLRVSL
jgi:hypothetical protein